jgi:hypothetical protein
MIAKVAVFKELLTSGIVAALYLKLVKHFLNVAPNRYELRFFNKT